MCTWPVRRTFLFQKTFYCPWDKKTGLIPLPVPNRYIRKGIETFFISGLNKKSLNSLPNIYCYIWITGQSLNESFFCPWDNRTGLAQDILACFNVPICVP